jgi:hypothetical protein
MNKETLKQLNVKSTILTLELVYETPKAYLVINDLCLTCEDDTWLPKSQCRLIHLDKSLITLEIPEWLAKKKNLK